MYVFFRLFKSLFLAAIRPRIGAFDTAVTKMRVWPNDLDFNLHLNNGRYLTLMDIGRFDLSWRSGLLQTAIRRGWLPVLGSAHIIFRRSLRLFQRFEMHTRIYWWDEKWFYIEQNFVSNGEICAQALVKGVFRHKGKNIPIPVIMETIGASVHYPEPPTLVRYWRDLESGILRSQKTSDSGTAQ